MTGGKRDLIEAVAEDICAAVFRMSPRVEGVDVTVKKPHVAVPGVVDFLGVTVRRERSDFPAPAGKAPAGEESWALP